MEDVKALNELLSRCADSEKGYKEACEMIEGEDNQLKSLFQDFSNQRKQFKHDIQGLIREKGGQPDADTTVLGDIHRSWLSLKTAVSSKPEDAVLEEVKRGEEYALEKYNNTIAQFPPGSHTAKRLIEQRNIVSSNLDRINTLHEIHHEA